MTILLYHLTDLHQAASAAADRRAGHPADLHLSAAEAASAVAEEWAMVAADQAVAAVQEDADAKNYIKNILRTCRLAGPFSGIYMILS